MDSTRTTRRSGPRFLCFFLGALHYDWSSGPRAGAPGTDDHVDHVQQRDKDQSDLEHVDRYDAKGARITDPKTGELEPAYFDFKPGTGNVVDGPGKVVGTEDDVNAIPGAEHVIEVPTTEAQDKAILAWLKSEAGGAGTKSGPFGDYVAITHNCADFVLGALKAGHVDTSRYKKSLAVSPFWAPPIFTHLNSPKGLYYWALGVPGHTVLTHGTYLRPTWHSGGQGVVSP